MRYFMDTEFYEFQPTDLGFPDYIAGHSGSRWDTEGVPIPGANAIQLISIGIVAEDGREFYAENADFMWDVVPEDHWLQENVRPHLRGYQLEGELGLYISPGIIADRIRGFVDDDDDDDRKSEFWGWYCDYDWVVFCGLFGRMIDLPKGFPKYCNDVKQLVDSMGSIRLPEGTGNHHALGDARDVRDKYQFLVDHGRR